MADITINDLAEVTTIASGDFVAMWRTANGDTRKITRANLHGGLLTGGGTIATGGFTLTIPASGTAVLLDATQTLTNKTLTTPTISATGFTNAQHAHTGATSGGQLDHGAALSGLTDDDHTQYALLAGRSGGQRITGIASTGYALEVYRNLASGSTDSPVMGVTQDNASDDQAALYVQQDGTGDIAQFYDGATKTFWVADGGNVRNEAQTLMATDLPDRHTVTSGFKGVWIEGNSSILGSSVTNFQSIKISSNIVRQSSGWYLQDTSLPGWQFSMGHGSSADNFALYRTAATASAASFVQMLLINDSGVLAVGAVTPNASRLGIQAGTSSNDAAVGGVLYVTTTQTGNVGTGEDDLASYSVPANTLSANGMSLWFEAWGTVGGAFGAKQIRVRFGTSGTNLVVDTTSSAFGVGSNPNWRIVGRIVRTGAATQKATAEASGTSAGSGVYGTTSLNQTLSGAVTLKVTAEAVSTNDVVLQGFIVGWSDQNT